MENCKWHLEINGQHGMILKYEKKKARLSFSFVLLLENICLITFWTYFYRLKSGWISSVQLLSPVRLFAAPWITAHQASLSITNSQSLRKVMSVESVMPSSHLVLCHPPAFSFSQHQGLFQWVDFLYQVAKSIISSSNEYSGFISCRIDWFDLLAVQVTLKVFSNTTAQKHKFFGTFPSLWSSSHLHTGLLEKP